MPYTIVFLGTSNFAVPSLKALAGDDRFRIAGIVTQPDKPVGRDATLTPPPVKTTAASLGLSPVWQPSKLSEDGFKSWIEGIGPECDAFVVAAYGKIFPQWFLDLPKKAVINVHGSLLPRWRGPSPVHAAIAAGDAVSGATIMKTELEMDAGPILKQESTTILPDDTTNTLHDRIAMLGAMILPDTLADYFEGRISPVPQNPEAATVCRILTRDSGKLDWTKEADELARLVRAYMPWPGTWTLLEGKRFKILEARAVTGDPDFAPGTAFVLDADRPCVAAGNGTALELVRVQREGRDPINGPDFVNGYRNWENVVLA